ncbi:TonB-dependent receptor [Brevundimonas sp.]|uniref:TonB-dependent receptor n=1 Tax=Brevundimonas sp. TaxID=1871086 RepID=UPI00286C7430|nr:TonB-dependent receptor [Brevundimonas sp.]
MTRMTLRTRALGAASALAVATLLTAGAASAQSTTSTLRGTVYEGDAAEAGGAIVARDVDTGFVTRGRISESGTYVLNGLRPGTYEVTVTSADGQTGTDTVTLSVGQVATLDLDVSAAGAVSADEGTDLGDIVVTGRRIFEVRTSEVATNVSQQQISALPQVDRNFLNFAALAPGVVVSQDPAERTIAAGAQSANAINVFIDGQSQKSNILDGGFAGQDDSRGNPFPQGAIREFRVLTQNFKAEYEQASSAIITAVTASGTNDFHGEVFVTYQDSDWRSQDIFSERRGQAKPQLDRMEYGATLSGPIIQDRLHFLASYERKDETRSNSVFLNRTEFTNLFQDELGVFEAPFEQDLYFGKLSWQVDDRQIVDLTATYRTEQDIRDFGGQNSYSRANAINNETQSVVLRHQFQGDTFLNVASVDYRQSLYNPQALNFSDSGEQFRVYRDASATIPGFQFDYNQSDFIFGRGGGTNNQNIEDTVVTFRNDLTFNEVEFYGFHTIKMGVRYAIHDYSVAKFFNRNPQFSYDVTGTILGSSTIPLQVTLNLPTVPAEVTNNQTGLYIQDDWQITDKLELNLGIRWDYEDNGVNNDYVTPDNVRQVLAAFETRPAYAPPVNVDDYVADGDREAFKGAFQPRIGFSYDIFGDEQTVLFGGAGRYYDRIGFNFAFSERYSPVNRSRQIFFSPNGGAFGGRTDTIAWRPEYGTTAGLDSLLGGTQGRGEIFLIRNDAPMPHTDQFNLGARQKFGDIQTAVTFSYAKTKNEYGWYRLNVNDANAIVVRPSEFTDPATGQPYAYNDSVFYSDHDRERTYKAMYVTIDRPYTEDSGYGFNIAYTLADGEQNGSRDQGQGAFDFDYATLDASPFFNTPGVERHRVVASGTLRLPMDFMLSSVVTLGSGRPFTIGNVGAGAKPDWFAGYPDKRAFLPGLNFATRQVDLRLSKVFTVFGGQTVEAMVDAINVFDFRNYNGYNTGLRLNNNSPLADFNPLYGAPTSQALPTRTIQLGLRYRF